MTKKLNFFTWHKAYDQICAEKKGQEEAHIRIFYLIFKDDLFDQIHMEYGTFLVGGYKSGAMILNIIFFIF